ncbi:MAG: TIR domain-containing protein [Chloroflexota bacterium]|nr:TIR domain-containing protein [Chloroflexota bacterium]
MSEKADKQYKVLRVFIASPSDLNEERASFRAIIDEVNRIKAHSMGVHLEPIGWEDTLPGKGRPQHLINQDVEQCDLFVLLLWKRWGTPSGNFSSGTEEEFELAKGLNERFEDKPYILLYFKSVPNDMLADPGGQLKQVIAFRTKIERDRSFFYSQFDSTEEWTQKFREHLSRWLDDLPPLDHPRKSIEFPPEVEARIRLVEKKLEKISDETATSESKLEQVALSLGLKAIDAAREGRFTEAQAQFIASISTYENPDAIYAYVLFMEDLNQRGLVDEKYTKRREQAAPRDLAIATANLGTHFARHGDLEKAAEYFERAHAILINPKSVVFYSVFISYSSRDEALARKLHTDLQNHGIRCWFAPADIKIGDKLQASIETAIRVYDKLLLILSESSIQSVWVEREVETALEKERQENRMNLFPIRVDDEVMQTSVSIASYLRRTRHIGDFRNWEDPESYAKAFDRLLRDLRA